MPRPNGPFPAPESYDRDSCGPKPPRPGDVKTGIESAHDPVAALTDCFSPIPRMAPPPLGSVSAGGSANGANGADEDASKAGAGLDRGPAARMFGSDESDAMRASSLPQLRSRGRWLGGRYQEGTGVS